MWVPARRRPAVVVLLPLLNPLALVVVVHRLRLAPLVRAAALLLLLLAGAVARLVVVETVRPLPVHRVVLALLNGVVAQMLVLAEEERKMTKSTITLERSPLVICRHVPYFSRR